MGLGLALLVMWGCSSGRELTPAEKVVGTWKVSKPAKETAPDSVLEFTKDGKLIWSATVNDRMMTIDGTYKIEGDVIIAERDIGGEDGVKDTRRIKIKALSDTTLIIQAPEGHVDEFRRK
jgi:uncharacterized protein (TIGR03066 family)